MKGKLAKELSCIRHQRIHVDRQENQVGFTSSAARRPDGYSISKIYHAKIARVWITHLPFCPFLSLLFSPAAFPTPMPVSCTSLVQPFLSLP